MITKLSENIENDDVTSIIKDFDLIDGIKLLGNVEKRLKLKQLLIVGQKQVLSSCNPMDVDN